MPPKTKHLKRNIISRITNINHTEPLPLFPLSHILTQHISSQIPLVLRQLQQSLEHLSDLKLLLHRFNVELKRCALCQVLHVGLGSVSALNGFVLMLMRSGLFFFFAVFEFFNVFDHPEFLEGLELRSCVCCLVGEKLELKEDVTCFKELEEN